MAAIVTSDWFGNCSTALVVINLLVMCMPYAGQSTSYANLVETLENNKGAINFVSGLVLLSIVGSVVYRVGTVGATPPGL